MNKKIISFTAGVILILTIFQATGLIITYDLKNFIEPTMLNDAIIQRDIKNFENT